jgi:hypothetical protein
MMIEKPESTFISFLFWTQWQYPSITIDNAEATLGI